MGGLNLGWTLLPGLLGPRPCISSRSRWPGRSGPTRRSRLEEVCAERGLAARADDDRAPRRADRAERRDAGRGDRPGAGRPARGVTAAPGRLRTWRSRRSSRSPWPSARRATCWPGSSAGSSPRRSSHASGRRGRLLRDPDQPLDDRVAAGRDPGVRGSGRARRRRAPSGERRGRDSGRRRAIPTDSRGRPPRVDPRAASATSSS